MSRGVSARLAEKVVNILLLIVGGFMLYFTLQAEGLHIIGYTILVAVSLLLLVLSALTLIVKTE